MLEVFYGTDGLKARQKAQLSILAKIAPDQEVISLEADKYTPGTLLGVSTTSSLFGSNSIYLVDATDSPSVIFSELIENAEALAGSQNLFVCVVGALLAADKKKVSKHTSLVEEYKKDPEARFNAFQMADALALKDKRSLWLLLQEAKRNNMSAEEIIGTLWWQLKALRLASVTKTAAEAGMKDFPYQKAKKALRNFKEGELELKSRQLLKSYHEGHRGETGLDLALEAWVLTI